jgi:hypothetical protein
MTFQRYRGHRQPIGFLMSMGAMQAALMAVDGFLTNMGAMRGALTTYAEFMTSMANIKE